MIPPGRAAKRSRGACLGCLSAASPQRPAVPYRYSRKEARVQDIYSAEVEEPQLAVFDHTHSFSAADEAGEDGIYSAEVEEPQLAVFDHTHSFSAADEAE
jgi:hypothetical protein